MSVRNSKNIDFGVDSVQRHAAQTGLPPFLLVLALRLRQLGVSPEKSILWARSAFERSPGDAVLLAYEGVLEELGEQTSSLRVRDLCEKLLALDEETAENMRTNLTNFGWDRREPLRVQRVRIDIISRLLYYFYEWGDVSAVDVFLFTKILLRRFNKLLIHLAAAADRGGEDDVYFAALDPDRDEVSLSEHTEKLLHNLEEVLAKRGRYERWVHKRDAQAGK